MSRRYRYEAHITATGVITVPDGDDAEGVAVKDAVERIENASPFVTWDVDLTQLDAVTA